VRVAVFLGFGEHFGVEHRSVAEEVGLLRGGEEGAG
jgi:hypothetical protein